jgi:pyridoxal phosphate enzyme (YggS family)
MIQAHYEKVKKACGEQARLCVVSKKRSKEEIMSYYDAGERIFGENHAQELLGKIDLPADIQWQFIGHLQRNKVKSIVPYVSCIQSLDSLELAKEIDKQCAKLNKTMDVLCEFHMADEDENKSGHDPADVDAFVKSCMQFAHLNVCGIMAMGPHTNDTERIRDVFMKTHALYVHLQSLYGASQIHTLSMGMSSDYEIALACGSNMVRVGTYLFKED